ncbi:hypothetical protein ALC60_03257 [Trachymyrmex zeteki]|uniref:Uncharacterized protein n=1 Tax=Mycetomoellerius zeteki TaxID=64791 RepID=A0A151XBN0_9HYME|nr:hypothetical protein ALC60_03257 [Trachymyrmex zeteki]
MSALVERGNNLHAIFFAAAFLLIAACLSRKSLDSAAIPRYTEPKWGLYPAEWDRVLQRYRDTVNASSYEITFWFETQEATTLGYSGFLASSAERVATRRAGSGWAVRPQERRDNRHDMLGELQVKRKISVPRGREDGGVESGKRPRVHATKARAYTRSRRQREEKRRRKGPASEDREVEVEEDGSKPDTRFVRCVYPVEREREGERVVSSCLPQRGCSLALAVSSSVFDFALTCRHYAIRFGQPPVEKAPSWSWISITVVMATAIDSTGVRVDGEENGENERAGERTTTDGQRGGQGCLVELNSTGQFYGVGLEIRRSFEASHPEPYRIGVDPRRSPHPGDQLSRHHRHRRPPSRSNYLRGGRRLRSIESGSTIENRFHVQIVNRVSPPSFHRAPGRKLGRVSLIHALVDLSGVAFG